MTQGCAYPIGDPLLPGFRLCGARPIPGKPYCAEHAAKAYQGHAVRRPVLRKSVVRPGRAARRPLRERLSR
jgi:hypothetical protein